MHKDNTEDLSLVLSLTQAWTSIVSSLYTSSYFLGFFSIQLKTGYQVPSPSELLGKILIKNKKGSHEKPNQTKKTTAAGTEQTSTTAAATQDNNSQDPNNPATSNQENQGEIRLHFQKKGMYSYFLDVTTFMLTCFTRGGRTCGG